MIKSCFYLEDDLKRNASFAHPENVLLAMLQNERQYVKELVLRRILKARKITESKKTGQLKESLSPRLLQDTVTVKLIWDQIMNKNINIPIEKLPCHTQAVESDIKLVAEASRNVCESDAHDGYIKAKIKSRKIMTTFDTKSQYTHT
nr:unnamed protein product [Callosobruchus analis]